MPLLVARLFPSVVFLRRQIDNVHVDRLRLLQLGRDSAQTVGHLVPGNRDVLALDAGEGKGDVNYIGTHCHGFMLQFSLVVYFYERIATQLHRNLNIN